MKKSNKKKIEEFIRVDHAGERGAIKIYEGQLLALNTLVKDDEMKKTIEEMREHEREHANYFENEIKKRGMDISIAKRSLRRYVVPLIVPLNWKNFFIFYY